MEYSASLGITPKITTIGITILFAVLVVWPFIMRDGNNTLSAIYIPAILGLSYFAAYVYSPRHYAITENAVVIHRLIGNVVIHKYDIKSVEMLQKGLPFAMRTFGVGGLFGYFGTFYNFDLGNMNWYITRRDRTVLITTSKGKKIVISPDNREDFVKTLQK